MKNATDSADSSLSETMAARIEIEQMGDPAQQKKMTAAVQALDGVIETKIEKGARLRSQIRKARVQTC